MPGKAAGWARLGIKDPNPPKRLERVLSPSPAVGREDEEAPDGEDPDGPDGPDVIVTSVVGKVVLAGWVVLVGRVIMDVTDDIGLSNT